MTPISLGAPAELWRLVVDGDLSGADNMASDLALLESVATGRSTSVLRLYGWAPPCLSLGRHQGTAAADLEFCRREGLDVVRRPTGGRAVLHHLELTYAVVAPLGRGLLPRPLQEAYVAICRALVAACRGLGVAAELTSDQVNLNLPNPRTAVPCFQAPAGGEVVVRGRKLVGSAMRAHEMTILQHGAFLLDWDGRLQAGSMGLPDDSALRAHVTTLAVELGGVPPRTELVRALADGFVSTLGVAFSPSQLTADEIVRAAELAPECRVTHRETGS